VKPDASEFGIAQAGVEATVVGGETVPPLQALTTDAATLVASKRRGFAKSMGCRLSKVPIVY